MTFDGYKTRHQRIEVNGGYKHMNTEFDAVKAEEAMQALESSLQDLSQEEAESRLKQFGPNELREKKRTTALSVF